LRIGVCDLYYRGRTVGTADTGAVGTAEPGIGGEDVGTAILAAQHSPFGEGGKAVQRGGAVIADDGIGNDAVVESYVDAVVVPVKGYRLHVDVGVQ
jgi:hypothetical protein